MFSAPQHDRPDILARRPDYAMLLEAYTSAFYHRILKPGDAAIDAGANAGMHLFPIAAQVEARGQVFGFEANPTMVERLQSRAEAQKRANITLIQKAVHRESGEGSFTVYPTRPGLSHLSHDGPVHAGAQDLDGEVIAVRFTRMDDEIDAPIAFIKSDLEGGDFYGFVGARRILTEHRPLIIFENSRKYASQQFGYSAEEFFQYFDEVGYNLFDIHGVPLTPGRWEDKDISYEYIGVPREDARLADILTFTTAFWRVATRTPAMRAWSECAALGRSIAQMGL